MVDTWKGIPNKNEREQLENVGDGYVWTRNNIIACVNFWSIFMVQAGRAGIFCQCGLLDSSPTNSLAIAGK